MMNKIWDINSHARVVGYGRVSTEKQEDNTSLKGQETAYKRDRERYGWVEFPFIEESGSGTSIRHREGIQEVLRIVRSGEVDAVWVIDTDRLCRPEDLRDLAEIYDIFLENDVKLVTPTRIYDLSIDNDLFSFDIEGVLAKHNRRRLLQNMYRGKVATAKDGRNAGGAAPDGYIVDPKTGRYLPDPDRAEYARLAWDLVLNHDYTLRDLVKEFDKRGIRSVSGKKWSMTHFHDMFYNKEYLGKYIYGKTKFVKNRATGRPRRIKVSEKDWIVIDNAHEPLVSEKDFYGVHKKLKWRRKRLNHNTHLLTAIATCYLCGTPLHVKYSGRKRIPKYVCSGKRKNKTGCLSRWLCFHDLNERIWGKFKLLLENPALIEKLATPIHNVEYRLKELRNRQEKILDEIERVKTRKSRLLDLFLDSRFAKTQLEEKEDELNRIIIGYEKDYKLATAGIKALEEQPNDLTEIIKYMKVLCYSDTKLSYDQKVRIFRQFVWRVKLDENLNFELELYKTPIGEIPANFRSFPRKSAPPVAVKGAILNRLGDVFGQNVLTASEVTHSSSDF